jgi:hypothetical protein
MRIMESSGYAREDRFEDFGEGGEGLSLALVTCKGHDARGGMTDHLHIASVWFGHGQAGNR